MAMQPEELKAMRVAAGMSQADLATEIGMARESIGQMERGQAPIERRTELAIRYVVEQGADKIDRAIDEGLAAIERIRVMLGGKRS